MSARPMIVDKPHPGKWLAGFEPDPPRYVKGAYFKTTETWAGGECDVRYSLMVGSESFEALDDDAKREFVYQRALRNLKFRVLALGATHMVTLTYRECLVDLEASRAHLREFWRLVKKKIPSWKFVGVAEFQERGAVHWHLAVKGFQPVEILRGCWHRVVGINNGNIDAKYFRGKGAAAIADYITKYLGKGFEVGERPRYSHYYITSRGLTVETQVYQVMGYTASELRAYCAGLIRERGGKVAVRWWNDDGTHGGARTW